MKFSDHKKNELKKETTIKRKLRETVFKDYRKKAELGLARCSWVKTIASDPDKVSLVPENDTMEDKD